MLKTYKIKSNLYLNKTHNSRFEGASRHTERLTVIFCETIPLKQPLRKMTVKTVFEAGSDNL